MCGIVGLLMKNPAWDERLGELLVPMLVGMTERGPDSAGMAVFGRPARGEIMLSLFQLHGQPDWLGLLKAVKTSVPGTHHINANGQHAVLHTTSDGEAIRALVKDRFAGIVPLAAGSRIQLYKDIGAPAEIAARYHFDTMVGTHAVGHTRMATESAVTPDRAHPFTAGRDFCLVHNGSLSNPYRVRRQLEPLGIHFDTDNDTEAACRFLEWRMREGDAVDAAIEKGFEALDGFFTFLIGTADGLALVRDPFACKPAIVAETADYVAISSEFRSLAHLPGVSNAKLFEPQPRTIYHWSRA
ncbi:MAG TPA: class II glutamine amidotransferase [Steroidobacteraceae bacterium]|nr:class II glutamine amidotransferase [Steroidobacteraceae bacterium]